MKNSRGFAFLPVLLVILGAAVISGGAYFLTHKQAAQDQLYVDLAPAASSTPTSTANTHAVIPPTAKMGVIKGVPLSASCDKPTIICAIDVSDANKKYCGAPSEGYCPDDPAPVPPGPSVSVPAGTYYVYATIPHNLDLKAYYDQFVICGGSANCPVSSHAKYIPVQVAADATVQADTSDWSSWQGTPDDVLVENGLYKYYSQGGFTLLHTAEYKFKDDSSITIYPFSIHPMAYVSITDDSTQTHGYLSINMSANSNDLTNCMNPGAVYAKRTDWFEPSAFTSSNVTIYGRPFTRSDRIGSYMGVERDYTTYVNGKVCWDIEIVASPSACISSGCANGPDRKWSTETEKAMVEKLDHIAQTFQFLQQ